MGRELCPVCRGSGFYWVMANNYYGIECWKCLGFGYTMMSNYGKEVKGKPTDVVGNDQIV